MNAAYLSALSALAGSAIGALASLATTWLTQSYQDRTQRAAQEASRRERLFGEFIDQASKLFGEALIHSRGPTLLNANRFYEIRCSTYEAASSTGWLVSFTCNECVGRCMDVPDEQDLSRMLDKGRIHCRQRAETRPIGRKPSCKGHSTFQKPWRTRNGAVCITAADVHPGQCVMGGCTRGGPACRPDVRKSAGGWVLGWTQA